MHHFLSKINHSQYLLLGVFLVLTGCKKQEAQPELPLNAALGYPSQASKVYDYKIAERFLVEKPEYSLCYSGPDAAALWASWHLQKSDLGNAVRQDYFRMDPEATFAIVKPNDFTGTGFDRGHLCPSGDRTSSQAANSATFLINNIIAQSPSLNRVV
ncbi:hypothetical protein C5O19_09560 [Siphonobacter curvatus]|uniref:Endonuclease n=1 Tax=Siphonobacter curvatus TaxID=2094562 RepID=A0A2S7IQD4_9BACT|nr:hypothetical protein C5O19_09560 [Siphonobacter curvatus]